MDLAFSFNPFALVSLFTVFLVLALMVYIVRQKYQTATLRWLLAVMCAILLWALAEFMIRISSNLQTAQLFKFWEMAGYISLGPAAVGLSLAFVKKEYILTKVRWLLLLFLPAIIFIFAAWTQNAFVDFNQAALWHQAWYGDWTAPLSPFFTWAFIPWLNLLLLFSIVHLVVYYHTLTSPTKKRQARIVIIGVVLPAIFGLITDQLFSTLTGQDGLELATLTTSLSGLWFTYGIIKYQLFEVNPAVIATNILSVMPEVVIVCNPKWEIEYASPPAKQLLGFDPTKLLGQPLHTLITDGWDQLDPDNHGAGIESKGVEITIRDIQGQSIPLRITPTLYRGANQKVLAVVLLLVDLRQMRELLNITEERNKLHATLSSISDGIIGLTSSGAIGLTNHSLVAMFNLVSSTVQNQRLESCLTFIQDSTPLSMTEILAAMSSNQQQQLPSVTATTPNGKRVEVNLTVTKLPQESQVDLIAIITLQNVSKERQLEKMKANFTYLAAHELRTPLTSIRGYLHLLKDDAALSPENQQVLERAVSSTEQLSLLVSRLLEVSEIEQSRLQIVKKPMAWDAFIVGFIASYQQQAVSEGWQLTLQNISQSVIVAFDPERMSQALAIIMDNAIKYTKGVAAITFSTELQANTVVIRIIDQGQGMDQELLAQLFTPFSRADTGFEQTEQGIGLSLYIAKSIISLHGGTITAESSPHHGSTFTVTIPLEIPQPPRSLLD